MNEPSPSDLRFAPRHCGHCGAQNDSQAQSCGGCGATLASPKVSWADVPAYPESSTPVPASPAAPVADLAAAPRRSRLFWAVLSGLVLALGASAAVAVFVVLPLFRAQHRGPALLPATTQIYASFNPHLGAVPGFERLKRAFEQAAAESLDARLAELLQQELGVDLEADVRPWVGPEIAVAVQGLDEMLDLERLESGEPAPDRQVVLLFASSDDARARQFLDQVRAHREAEGDRFAGGEYQGVAYTTVQKDRDSGASVSAYAIVESFVVLASNEALLKDVIDRAQSGEQTLAQSPAYQSTLEQLPQDAVGYFYVSGSFFNTIFEQSAQASPLLMNPGLLQQSQELSRAFQGLGVSLSLSGQGVQMDMAMKVDASQLSGDLHAQLVTGAQPLSDALLHSVSRDASLFYAVSIHDSFARQMQNMLDSLGAAETLDELESAYDLDLQRDLLSWLNGELAIVLMAPSEDDSPLMPFGSLYMVVRSKDMTAAEAGLSRLAEGFSTVAGQPGTLFQKRQVGGLTWNSVADASPDELLGGYALQQDAVLIAIGPRAMRVAGTAASDAITGDPVFTRARAHFVDQPAVLFYLNGQDLLGSLDPLLEQSADPAAERASEALKLFDSFSLSGSSSLDEQGFTRARVFIGLHPEQ